MYEPAGAEEKNAYNVDIDANMSIDEILKILGKI